MGWSPRQVYRAGLEKKFLKHQNNHGKNHKGMLRRKNVANFQSKL